MPHPDDRERESRRILKQVDQTDGTAWLRGSAERTRSHLKGDDADPADPIEVWGTRIGRSLSLIVVILLIGWLASLISTPG